MPWRSASSTTKSSKAGSGFSTRRLLMLLEFSMTATVALRARVKRACFALQDDHVADELYRNPEPGRSRTMRMPYFYEPDDPQPKRHRMWSTHLAPPISAIQTGNQKSGRVEILDRKNRNTL